MRRMIVLTAALVILATAAPAVAHDGPVAGCGNGFTLDSVQGAIDAVDTSIYSGDELALVLADIASRDVNTDDHLCWKHFAPNPGQDKFWGATDYIVTLVLDNNAVGRP